MGVAAGSVRAGHGEDARRALGLAPSVRPGAQRAPRRCLHSRVKASKQARKDSRAARVADVTLRYRQVALPCPGAAAVELWVVHAREEHPPPTAEPLEWFVLTTLPVTSTGCAKLPPIHHVRLGLSALGRRPGRDG